MWRSGKSSSFCWSGSDPLQILLSGEMQQSCFPCSASLPRDRPSSPCDNKHRCYPCMISHMHATLYGEKCCRGRRRETLVFLGQCSSTWEITTRPGEENKSVSHSNKSCSHRASKDIKTSKVSFPHRGESSSFVHHSTKLHTVNQLTSEHTVSYRGKFLW